MSDAFDFTNTETLVQTCAEKLDDVKEKRDDVKEKLDGVEEKLDDVEDHVAGMRGYLAANPEFSSKLVASDPNFAEWFTTSPYYSHLLSCMNHLAPVTSHHCTLGPTTSPPPHHRPLMSPRLLPTSHDNACLGRLNQLLLAAGAPLRQACSVNY
tara:strand:- start:274 stop:735 length:462 start_codon:yes stop_codon:yes gene_type:complete